MKISLKKARISDAKTLHNLKIESFLPLLKIYKDFDTNPATEYIDKIMMQINNPLTDYYLINYEGINVGGIRIVRNKKNVYRVSPIYIIPKFHNMGIAQEVFRIIESMYLDANRWQLDTILEENGLCYLYEKIGYVKTGKTKTIKDKFTLVFYAKEIS